VGGKWYEIIGTNTLNDDHELLKSFSISIGGSSTVYYYLYSTGYYEFTEVNDKYYFIPNSQRINDIYQSGEMDIDTEVYSKDGMIYRIDINDDKNLMSYEFHDQYPFAGMYSDVRSYYDKIAADGNFLTYLLYETNGLPITGTQWTILLRNPDND
jgi:hypothetical protein